ncbi:uncharacterized protein KNAG_0C02470 [Huiozyma naganishii CBS 8797]|uniref:Cell wall mannoprotein PIR1-like C-terminal domain-containing protein n=1 Tax=Huiozyma naganishii (strain ATCC MYA-139 / BCRC 22969 / CBS 8797 / KCTC 17520 / NBRC 10181 / NCYC 3082 / Yp74L-3) TaxID=1071383 RepID=J7RIK6_HUIN7|nr:hypothetical protein KNAG_0C02470 [Kazachstania naganishii CBS 8797]CCK69358.1 hypothetical protein KNAG_0C02470 [Kazachstania naganishii CBS 8797]
MQFKETLLAISLASSVLGAYVPSEPWSTLTPSATYKNGISSYVSTFGIAVEPISGETSSASQAKRDVISQITDGQIQATTSTKNAVSKKPKTSAAAPVSQITDGQIQATTKTKNTVQAAASQITDGQVQATTQAKTTAAAASQITDGQVQATTKTTTGASQVNDGQVQATATTSAESTTSPSDPVDSVSCKTSGTLELTLKDGVLTDSKGRIGSIVSNRQFQFDGPPPQAGAIYAAGWSITGEGNLALGDQDVFYQCLSGNFYNLYDQSIGTQCNKVYLTVIDLVDC